MPVVELVRTRIESGKFKASDIRKPGLLTDDEIAYLPIPLIYQWIRAGDWKRKDFEKWLRVIRVIE